MTILGDAFLDRSRLQRLAVLSLFLLMPVDNLNAFLQRSMEFGGSVSQAYKLIVHILCIAAMSSARQRPVIFSLCAVMIWTLIHGWSSPMANATWLVSDFAFMFKWISPLIIFLFVDEIAASHQHTLNRLFVFSFALLGINLFVSLFGIGYSQYGNGVGALGFFIAGNEVSGMQLVISSAVLAFSYQRGLLVYLFVAGLAILLGAMKGTKTGMLGVFIICVLTPATMGGFLHGKIPVRKTIGLLTFGGFLFAGAAYSAYQLIQKLGIIERFLYFLGNRGLFAAVFSGRETRPEPFLDEFVNTWTYLQRTFGIGAPDAIKYGYIELDFFDLLSSQGILGAFLILIMWSILWGFTLQYSFKGSRFATQASVLLLALFIICNMSGHIFYSALAMPYLGVYLGLVRHMSRVEGTVMRLSAG